MVGFAFSEGWATKNLAGIQAFLRATAKADELLATSDKEWDRLKSVMGENDPNFNEATFEALRRRYREGIPERSVSENEADAKVLYQFLRELGGEKLVGPATELAPGTFWNGSKS
jgi:NitT/TauT family transport system substrate-binding protein